MASVLAGARDCSVNDLRVTQTHFIQSANHVVIHNSASIVLSQTHRTTRYKRNKRLAPPDSYCLPGTRKGVFEELHSWVKTRNEITVEADSISDPGGDSRRDKGAAKPICWLYDFVGCGKSAIAQSIAEEYARRNRLAVSFRNAGDRSSIDRFAVTLAHQIALNVPGAKALIEQTIVSDEGLKDASACSLKYQLEPLVYDHLLNALKDCVGSEEGPYLMLVDGLDEDKEGISVFIKTSIEFFSRNPAIPVRLLITSRIEEHIRTFIEGEESIYLIDLVSKSSRTDVASLMKTTFMNARKHDRALRALGDTWPEPQDMDQLVDYCDRSFIFGSTLGRFILKGSGEDDPRTPMDRLPLALKINPGLDGVFIEILSRAQILPHFHMIMSTIACIQTPLSIVTMAALLCLSTYAITRVLVVLQAILQVPGRDGVPVSLFHTSLRDFLRDKTRSGELHSPPSHHTYLMHRCLDLLVGMDLSADAECCKYALLYWPAHLEIALTSDETFDWEAALGSPYKLFDSNKSSLKSNFKARWVECRPLHLTLSEGEWAEMMRNFRRADVASRGRGLVDEIRIDIFQGFCTLMSAINSDSWKLHFAIRRSEDISINIEFNRTRVASSDDERYKIPGGSKVTIKDDLNIGLYSFDTLP
ncbi:hypothetical protein FA13DRAFT_1796432 [Coprinellus micaceus]|uniref:Nephrocystin 3-like N-terminal domain-containing protein n=1 Tax=Coprinellus micaceus TaxID=71717 RepID=A0A4Y7SUJ7_COPMI|nr:hypothetical protein FA13DRAFT_1796432 [Coprinellus micaceus]